MGEQQSGRPSLPEAWRAAVRMCPYCSGLGKDHGADCQRCGGSGDLVKWLLEEAYRAGRSDALVAMRETFRVARLAGEQVKAAPVPADLRTIVGLPR